MPTAYVANQGADNVIPIDLATNVKGTPISITSGPIAVAVTPDGTKLYVVTSAVRPVTLPSTVGSAITVGTLPFEIAITPDGSKAYVPNQTSGNVSVINIPANTIAATIAGTTLAQCVAITPDGSTVYIGNGGATDTISVITVSSNTITHTITGISNPSGMAVTPDGTMLYECDRGTNAVIPITVATNALGTPISLASHPQGICITPDGATAYVALFNGTVVPITIATNTAGTPISVGSGASTTKIACSLDGTTVYVGNSTDNTVVPITVATNTAGAAITGFNNPEGIAMAPTPPIDVTVETPVVVAAELAPTVASTVLADTPVVVVAELAPTFAAAPSVTIHTPVVVAAELAPVFLPAITDTVTTTVVAGPARLACYLRPSTPVLAPGPFGNHEYEVVVCDKYGIAKCVIPSAVVTQIDYELDSIGQATIDFDIMDIFAELYLPLSSIPGVAEIQIWRDHALIWWGWPCSATWDAAQVHLTCQGLLWPLSRREFGPGFRHYLVNPQFELGLANWVAVNCLAYVDTTTKLLGKQAARLFNGTPNNDSFLEQDFIVDLTGYPSGLAFALAAWFYIDGNYPSAGPALDNRGLFVEDSNGVFSFVSIDANTPANTWTRIELTPTSPSPAFVAQPGVVTTYNVRLYCPEGSIVWDYVELAVYENVSSPPPSPPATAWDVSDIIRAILESAQSPQWGKSDLAYSYWAAPTGIMLNRVYDVSQSEVILDAINEFPTTGIADVEMIWDDTGHFRGMEVYSPSKGQVKYNYVVDVSVDTTTTLAGAVDGTQVGTNQRVLGQGSSGPSNETGYAQFASYLGGRVVHDAVFVSGSDVIDSATAAFTSDDVGVNCYSLNGGLPPNTLIVSVTSATEAVMSNTALLNLTGETFGVGGITLDTSTSAIQNQPVSTLQQSAQGYLVQQMKAQALPAPRMRADGPNGLFGFVSVGDVLPVSADYGWLQIPPTMMRIAKLSLYPPTEELEFTLMGLNTWVTPS